MIIDTSLLICFHLPKSHSYMYLVSFLGIYIYDKILTIKFNFKRTYQLLNILKTIFSQRGKYYIYQERTPPHHQLNVVTLFLCGILPFPIRGTNAIGKYRFWHAFVQKWVLADHYFCTSNTNSLKDTCHN